MNIVFYVSGHGFGHAVRAGEVMRALLARGPRNTRPLAGDGVRIHVRTTAPAWLLPVDPAVTITPARLDVGVVQAHSLTLDPAATLAAIGAINANGDALAKAEADFLRDSRAAVVVADIPAIPFRAARMAGIPSVGIANFSWDWIYRAYLPAEPGFAPVIAELARDYGEASLLLRLPYHGDLSAFPRIQDIPFIARRATQGRARLREALDLPEGPVALLTFGGFGLAPLPVADIARALPRWTFVLPRPIDGKRVIGPSSARDLRPAEGPANLRVPLDGRASHADLVAAADVVVTKPGYGIVAECLANRARVLYTERGDFPEYPILAAALERHASAGFIAPADLLAGRIGDALESLLAAPEPRDPLTDAAFEGADRAALAIRALAAS